MFLDKVKVLAGRHFEGACTAARPKGGIVGELLDEVGQAPHAPSRFIGDRRRIEFGVKDIEIRVELARRLGAEAAMAGHDAADV